MNRKYFINCTTYEDDDESSGEECCKSSDDEETDREFRDFLKSSVGESTTKSATMSKKQAAVEFEREMNAELDAMFDAKHASVRSMMNGGATTTDGATTSKQQTGNKKDEEEEESDTDSEAELATGVRTKKKRKHFTNDELLYDPEADDADEKWINEKRKMNQQSSKQKNKAGSSSHSDAVLNCPCCMTMLTMDCQRHEKYATQYRAMFVFNCHVKQDEQLKMPKGSKSKDHNQEYETFKPLECEFCKTEVGVYDDKNEIYYLFNVLASHT